MKNNLNKMKDVVAHQSVLVNVTTFLNYTYFLSLQSMKNVTCWKLIIDRQKAPLKTYLCMAASNFNHVDVIIVTITTTIKLKMLFICSIPVSKLWHFVDKR